MSESTFLQSQRMSVQFYKFKLRELLFLLLVHVGSFSALYAQPAISYTTPQAYIVNQAISTLTPSNSGTAVPAGSFRNVTNYAGSGTNSSTNNSNPLLATFTDVYGIIGDAKGNYYVAENSPQCIRKIAANSGAVTTVISSLGNIMDLVINTSTGDIYFSASNRIYKLQNTNSANYPSQDPVYSAATLLAGQSGTGSVNGTGSAATFNAPSGLDISPDNSYLLVADYNNHRIRKVIISSGEVTTLVGTGTAGFANGNISSATISYPRDVAFASSNLIYVVEELNAHNIRKVDLSQTGNEVSLFAGSSTNSIQNQYGALDGQGSAASFNMPWSLTVDGAGNLYISDKGLDKIRKISPSGMVSTLVGSLWQSNGSTNAVGTEALFNNPTGVYFDPITSSLIVGDNGNNKVRKVDLSGFIISHPLPAGLSFNTSTGVITGTPTDYSLSTYYSNNFDDASLGTTSAGGTPTTNGNAELVGGMLRVTKVAANQYGGFMIPAGGANSNLLKVDFTLITGAPGVPANGISYSFASDASVTNSGNAEDGTGTKLKVCFRDKGVIGIYLYYGTTLLTNSSDVTWTQGKVSSISISINQYGKLSLTLNGSSIFSNIQLPSDYLSSDKSLWNHVFKSRTDGSNYDLHAIDNLVISKGLGQATYKINAYNYGGVSSFDLGLSVSDPAPTVTSFSPASGPVGTLVTVTGTYLNNLSSLSIGGVNAVVISNTGTSLVGMVMPGALTGSVSVTTAFGNETASGSFSVISTFYPNTQQGNKLTGTGTIGAAELGFSSAISADGKTAIVGAQTDNGNNGAAFIFVRNGTTWSQEAKLVGTGNVGAATQGVSVAISADGNTVIIGGQLDNNNAGAAWVFTRSGTTWTQQAKLRSTNTIGTYTYQGFRVSLSADGNTAAIGGHSDNNNTGAVWVFNRVDGNWLEEGKLVGTGAIGQSDQSCISLSADGNTAIVGGYGDNSNFGAIWFFTRTNGIWTQQGNKFVVTDAIGGPFIGFNAAISADGNTAITGGRSDNSGVGAAWIFTRSGSTWSQQAKLVGTGNTGLSTQGTSISISADGNTAIVGGAGDNSNTGAFWVFTRSGSTWTQQGSKYVGTGNSVTNISGRGQGASIAISATGAYAFIGSNGDASNAGAAWAFVSSVALPVNWLTFTGMQVHGDVELNWSTASEINNSHFEIQRSANAIDFSTIGSVAAGTNPSVVNNYQYLDVNPLTGISYYRLKQIDIDGKYSFSSIIQINGTPLSEIKIYSDAEALHVLVPASVSGSSIAFIYDATGRLMQKQQVLPGRNVISTAGLSGGNYFVQLVNGGKNIYSNQFIK